MSLHPLLTICIPTYNRAGHVQKLLEYLTSNGIPGADYDVEIVVVNNCSKDDTRQVLDRLKEDGRALRIIHREQFLLTAEENIIHSLQFCAGEYVWFLGDDDVPVLHNFAAHYRRLQEGKTDYFLFNPAMLDAGGTLTLLQNIKMNRDSLAMSMADLVVTVGCLFNIAGISNQIIRRRLLTTERGVYFMERSKIYSMVAWIIDAGKDAAVELVNRPLVYYRANDYGNQHWQSVAKRMGVGDHHFWSTGLVELFEKLIADGVLTPWTIGQIMEITPDRGPGRIVDDMLVNFYLQLKVASTGDEPRQRIAAPMIDRAAKFFARTDATCYDLFQGIRALHAAVEARSVPQFDQAEAHFLRIYKARTELGRWAHRIEQVCYGYAILRTPIQYTAVFSGDPAFRDAVMDVIDPLPSEPLVLTAPTWAELHAQLVVAAPRAHELKQTQARSFAASPLESDTSASVVKRAQSAEAELRAIYHSGSWQLTYPLRAAKNGLQAWRTARRASHKARHESE